MSNSKNKIDIVLERYSFKPGEHITGKLFLTLSKAVYAKELVLRLIGEEEIKFFEPNRSGSRTERSLIYDFELILDKEHRYETTQNPIVVQFDILIPSEILKKYYGPDIKGTMGKIIQAANVLKLFSDYKESRKTTWYLIARLKVKGLFNDIKKQIQVNVG